jgi:hypothetical protein
MGFVLGLGETMKKNDLRFAFVCGMSLLLSCTSPEETLVECDQPENIANGSVSIVLSSDGGAATYSCNDGYGLSGSPTRDCGTDGLWSGETPSCSDIDECVTDHGGCDSNATCTNNTGTAPTCTCKGGYNGDGTTCTDIDECATNNGGCDSNATCTNNVGSLSCTCNDGYSGDGTTCADIDECATNNGGCDSNAICTNNVGEVATCACNDGYSGDGTTCTDIDECSGITCSNGGTCTEDDGEENTGEYTCTCATGYEGGGITTTTCTDIDECATNDGGCNTDADEICINTAGGFICRPLMKIGLLNPITGPIAEFAPGFTVAAGMAIEDLNALGGNFELVEEDSGCDGTTAADSAEDLVNAAAVGVAGAACSGASIAANGVLSAANIVQVSYSSTVAELSDASTYPGFWRVVPSDAQQAVALADVLNADDAGNVALMHLTNTYGADLADAFAAAWEVRTYAQQLPMMIARPILMTRSTRLSAAAATVFC